MIYKYLIYIRIYESAKTWRLPNLSPIERGIVDMSNTKATDCTYWTSLDFIVYLKLLIKQHNGSIIRQNKRADHYILCFRRLPDFIKFFLKLRPYINAPFCLVTSIFFRQLNFRSSVKDVSLFCKRNDKLLVTCTKENVKLELVKVILNKKNNLLKIILKINNNVLYVLFQCVVRKK